MQYQHYQDSSCVRTKVRAKTGHVHIVEFQEEQPHLHMRVNPLYYQVMHANSFCLRCLLPRQPSVCPS